MSRLRYLIILLFLVGGSVFPQSDIWVTAYYTGYSVDHLKPDSIDYNAFTHLIHFALIPIDTGGLDASSTTGNDVVAETSNVATAHSYGRKVLICIGGAGSQVAFEGATRTSPHNYLSTFDSNIMAYVRKWNYDGVDIDWENLEDKDSTSDSLLIWTLRDSLNAYRAGMLLTATIASPDYAAARVPARIALYQAQLDQINLQTYDLAGAWGGWPTWHNAPIYDGGATKQGGALLPSANGLALQFYNAGVALNKMSIGIDFDGSVWWAGTDSLVAGAPRDPRRFMKIHSQDSVRQDLAYYTIMDTVSQSPNATLVWDIDSTSNPPAKVQTEASYYRVINSVAAKDSFVTFDNQQSCVAKVDYSRNPGISGTSKLGGVTIWDLSGGWRDRISGAGTFRDSLLQSIKTEIFGNYAYKYKLQQPWKDASSSVTVNYSDATEHYLGTQSIKITKTVSGGYFGMQYGNSSGTVLNPAQFSKLEFHWYSTITPPFSGATANLALNGSSTGFVSVALGTINPGWSLMSIKMTVLNPNNKTSFNQLIIQDGRSSITYWLDDIHFFKSDTVAAVLPTSAAMTCIPEVLNNFVDTVVYHILWIRLHIGTRKRMPT